MEYTSPLVIILILLFVTLLFFVIYLKFFKYRKKDKLTERYCLSIANYDIPKEFEFKVTKSDLKSDFSKEVKSDTQNLFVLDEVINNIDIGLAFITENNIIFKSNKFFEEIFYPDVPLGQDIDELLKSLTYKDKFTKEKRYMDSQDTKISLKINDQLRFFTLKRIPFVSKGITMVVLYDISELKRLELELEKYKKLNILKVIAGSLAHDLNNQLGVILAHSEILLRQTNKALPKEFLRTLEIIKRTCLRAKTLTQELLIFGKPLNPVKEIIPLKGFLSELAEFTFAETEISLNYSYDPRIQIIKADRNLLEIAIHNVFLNAKQAMQDKGSIFISTDYKPPYVEIAIRDTGPGIPQEVKEKLFSPFVTTKPKGTGLGLYSIKKILESHEGKVAIESTLGEGTTVKLYLPAEKIAEEDIRPHQPSQTISPNLKKLKILYMDDDKDIREAVIELIESLDHKVIGCETGEEAIKIYQERGPFDVFIFDLSVPGKFDGFQTLREIRKIDPHVKAILATGHTVLKEHEELKDLNIYSIMLKPFTVETLFNTISKISQESQEGP